MMEFTFEPASKDQAKARVALAGPPGSGKTFTSLVLATVLAGDGPVALIDTERGSASKYAWNRPGPPPPGLFRFQRLNMQRYDPRDLPKALASAAAAEFPAVIIDSLSKFWSGQGGMLEFVDDTTKRSASKNAFTSGWKEARPVENELIEAMLSYPGHVIVTMRTKTHYDVIDNGRGQKIPTKIGLQPVQREGIEYEFDIVGDMDPMENTLIVSKSRCAELSGRVIRQPGADLAETILAWLTDGEAVLSAKDYRDMALNPDLTYAGAKDLYRQVERVGLLGTVVPDQDGSATNLMQLIISQGKAAEAREMFAAKPPAVADAAEAAVTVLEAAAEHPAQPSATDLAAEAGVAREALEEHFVPPDMLAVERDQQGDAGSATGTDAPAEPAAEERQPPPDAAAAEAEWVAEFSADLASADADGISELRRRVTAAKQTGTITPAIANELLASCTERKRDLARAAAA